MCEEGFHNMKGECLTEGDVDSNKFTCPDMEGDREGCTWCY